jgi:hypothetical protein
MAASGGKQEPQQRLEQPRDSVGHVINSLVVDGHVPGPVMRLRVFST